MPESQRNWNVEDPMFDSQTLPVLLGFVILIAILVPNVLLLVTYRKYRRLSKLLPEARVIDSTKPEALTEKTTALAAVLVEEWSRLPDKEAESVRHALWMAMLLEAAADGSIDHREMRFIADLFGRISGQEMEFTPVIHAAELVERDRKSAFLELAEASGASKTAKEQILAGAFLVSVSDHALSEREVDCLGEIAGALSLGRRDQRAMLERITQRFGVKSDVV